MRNVITIKNEKVKMSIDIQFSREDGNLDATVKDLNTMVKLIYLGILSSSNFNVRDISISEIE